MRFKTVLTLLAASGLLAGSAGTGFAAAPETTDKPARQCFWTNRISSFAAPDDKTVNVRVGVKDVYQFELLGRCPEIDWNQNIAVRSRGGSYICSGLDAEVISPSSIGPQRCAVRTVRKLTEAEVKALPKGGRP
jgi:hypothetical protein